MFFQKPTGKSGHCYQIDEVNGKKIAVNRISHSKVPKNKMQLPSMPLDKSGTPSYLQLETEYFGRKGKAIRFKDAKVPHPGSPEPTSKEKGLAQKYAIRDPEKKNAGDPKNKNWPASFSRFCPC